VKTHLSALREKRREQENRSLCDFLRDIPNPAMIAGFAPHSFQRRRNPHEDRARRTGFCAVALGTRGRCTISGDLPVDGVHLLAK